jgi:anti-anti-sigma regulatory factor
MWGVAHRSPRSRSERSVHAGGVRVVLRGPAEHTVLEFEGELDFTCTGAISEKLVALPDNVVELDVSQLEFVDAEGVGCLRAIARHFARDAEERSVVPIRGMRRSVSRAFELVGAEVPSGYDRSTAYLGSSATTDSI